MSLKDKITTVYVARLEQSNAELLEALEAMLASTDAFASDIPSGNPYFCPQPKQGQSLATAATEARTAIAKARGES